ncbi:hypothetical protein [Candidatus Nitrospira bockiana]
MEPTNSLAGYRRYLIRLLAGSDADQGRDLDELQVFGDSECLGTVECGHGRSTLRAKCPRPLESVYVRSADGLLLSSLFIPSSGSRTVHIKTRHHRVEVEATNDAGGTSIRVAATPLILSDGWRRAWAALPGAAFQVLRGRDGGAPRAGRGAWARRVAFAQTVVTLSVALLAGVLVWDRFQADNASLQRTADQAELLLSLSTAQQKRFETLEREVHQQLAGLDRRFEERHTAAMHEAQRVQAEVARLASAKEALVQQVALLEGRQAALVQSLKEQLRVADAKASAHAAAAPLVADAKGETPSPFTFWVSFKEGTPKESIEGLIQDIKGRPGRHEGDWYSVEVTLPKQESRDKLLESVQQRAFVKALKTSLQSGH